MQQRNTCLTAAAGVTTGEGKQQEAQQEEEEQEKKEQKTADEEEEEEMEITGSLNHRNSPPPLCCDLMKQAQRRNGTRERERDSLMRERILMHMHKQAGERPHIAFIAPPAALQPTPRLAISHTGA